MNYQQTYCVVHLFCGISGAAIGMQATEAEINMPTLFDFVEVAASS